MSVSARRSSRTASTAGYASALDFLESLNRFGIRLGLQRMEALLAGLGHPERRIPGIVHVGGTNGKGSVSAMIAAVLQAAGHRTGLYTSPHLVDFVERFRVDGRDCRRAALARAILRVRPLAEALAAAGDPPTAFEVLTVAGYVLFAEAGVRWLVQEVGLGGRLDSTNVVERPAVTVVTNVGLDHTDRLGATVEAIAAEKAGIVKPGRPLVTAATGPALAVLRRRAAELGAPVVRVVAAEDDAEPKPGERVVRVRLRETGLGGTRLDLDGDLGRLDDLRVPLAGAHQALNAGVAVAALRLIASEAGLDEHALRAGLAAVRWPGRLELVRRRPPVLLDGAHNADGIAALVRALASIAPDRPVSLVIGVLADKRPALEALARTRPRPEIRRVFTVTPSAAGRALPAAETAATLGRLGLPAEPAGDPVDALARAVAAARADRPEGIVCVTGSLFLIGEVRARLRELARGRA